MPVDIRGYFKKYTQEEWDEKNSEEFAGIQARRQRQDVLLCCVLTICDILVPPITTPPHL
jgi:hypothetical protein